MRHHNNVEMDRHRCPECMEIMYYAGETTVKEANKLFYFHHYMGNDEDKVTVLCCIWCGKDEIIGGFCPRNEKGEYLMHIGR